MTMADREIKGKLPVIVRNGKEYLKVCPSEDVFEKKGVKVQFDEDDDRQVAVFRLDSKLYCLWNICPHRHQDQIHNGFIKDGNIICPVHGWTYNIETGLNVNPRQGMRSLQTFEIFEEDGYIFIEKPKIEIPNWRQD